MGREVRMVPPDWKHPLDPKTGHFQPKHKTPYKVAMADWEKQRDMWLKGYKFDFVSETWEPHQQDSDLDTFIDEWGGEPEPEYYMPEFAKGTATHLQMYETCSEGTPLSPIFATPEELARWLADNNASAFGSQGATYEQWLGMIQKGWAPSGVMQNGEIISGVAAVAED